jgi:DNA-binding beta-propeller fold protein YncE
MNRTILGLVILATIPWSIEADPLIAIRAIGKYVTGIAGIGATEIAAFDPVSKRVFSVNGALNTIDVIDLSDPADPILISSIGVASCAPGSPTSVAVRDGVVVVAAENAIDAAPGWAAFFTTQGVCLNAVAVGAGPDMVTFTHNGRHVLVANEGEAGIGGDPAGTVAVIDLTGGVENLTQAHVSLVTFDAFDKAAIDPRIHRVDP